MSREKSLGDVSTFIEYGVNSTHVAREYIKELALVHPLYEKEYAFSRKHRPIEHSPREGLNILCIDRSRPYFIFRKTLSFLVVDSAHWAIQEYAKGVIHFILYYPSFLTKGQLFTLKRG